MTNKARKTYKLQVSVCVPAFNEGKNIEKILTALTQQVTNLIEINRIVVVSSGSTDETNEITQRFVDRYSYVTLIIENKRMGKSAAINTFLKSVEDEIVVIESADTVPELNTIENLCKPFLVDEKIGMTGGAPYPVNDPETFLGHIVHTWWWFHRNIPRFGEIIAFRNIIPSIAATSSVDEAYIQAKFAQMGYKILHIDAAVVHNKGPETISDLIKQRRRVLNGHARLYTETGVKIDNMTKSSFGLILKFRHKSLKHALWFIGGMIIEAWSRILGHYDVIVRKINPFVWDTATSTKNLDINIDE